MINSRTRTRNRRRAAVVGTALVSALLTFGCSAQDPDQVGPKNDDDTSTAATKQPTLKTDPQLRAMLPADIKKSGKLVSVNSGSFPPYLIVGSDHNTTGASADLLNALGQLWGVKITEKTVDSLPSELTGISSGRYQMAFGPVGDFKERQQSNDFVDYVQEFVVFAVPKGNPKKITGLESACGAKIAAQAGGSAEKVIKDQQKKCAAAGKPKLTVMSFKDQPSSILAVQSGRADAFFSSQAPLTYFVKESGGKLELAGTGQQNGFEDLYQGAVVKKDSPLVPLLQQSLQKLHDNGSYDAIMKKWGLEANMIDKPGKNMAVS
ncbi:ABC transporter substrate-binding protein [Microlunatus soli]|uniref:Amino acid ABC transporter substrate-binding protein, PAAT family n=1 Tax=Microlunatus soli TaxID=630515 RepID=A0A1H1ZY31_9ACTN|nr:ABC transporter substrate-binding protein [Microlunatus soli]SDT38447.1 amino acid ABC transporter substrate-binding protein, PAAT family [Microlunatus soli]